jgi:hypothetical protein
MGSNAKVSKAGRFTLLPHQYPASPTRFPFMQAETPLRRKAKTRLQPLQLVAQHLFSVEFKESAK